MIRHAMAAAFLLGPFAQAPTAVIASVQNAGRGIAGPVASGIAAPLN